MGKIGSVNKDSALIFALLIDNKVQVIKAICGAHDIPAISVGLVSSEFIKNWIVRKCWAMRKNVRGKNYMEIRYLS